MPCSDDVQKQIGVAEFVMQDNPNMDYSILFFEECKRCKQFEPDHIFKHCSFCVTHKEDGTAVQEFECSRCSFKWEKIYASCSDNRSTFRGKTRQSELFESY